ncbi:MAG: hypothetical protein AAGK02_10720 [Pseudomonadota bacterium]
MTETSQRPATATPIANSRKLHAELIEPSTMRAWISLEPMEQEDFQALPLPADLAPAAIGRTAMEEHWFSRSPDQDEDGPMRLREVGSYQFGHCARALDVSQPFGPEGPRRVLVEKFQGGRFKSGSQVPFLVDPEGRRFVHIVDCGADPKSLTIPEGFEFQQLSLTEDWVFQLPNPTTAYFFDTGDSYQGPIDTHMSD